MASKKKIVFKKKEEIKPEVIEEENVVNTVIENEIKGVEEPKVEKSSDRII
jgi:hypothetical protein